VCGREGIVSALAIRCSLNWLVVVLLHFMVKNAIKLLVINRAPGAWSAGERFTRRRF
jgi:hypothetical protein